MTPDDAERAGLVSDPLLARFEDAMRSDFTAVWSMSVFRRIDEEILLPDGIRFHFDFFAEGVGAEVGDSGSEYAGAGRMSDGSDCGVSPSPDGVLSS